MESVVVSLLTPLTYSTRTDDCYCLLKQSIVELKLLPGAPLDEIQIAGQLGISKTPVREALARLAGEGFVSLGGGRKSRVTDLSLEAIREIYQVRILIESASVREIAPLLTESDLGELDELVSSNTAATYDDELRNWLAPRTGFHEYLIQKTRNACLIAIARGLFDQANRIRAAIYRSNRLTNEVTLIETGLRNHQLIVEALRAKDADRAGVLMRADIQMYLDAVSTPEMQEGFNQLRYPQ